MDDKGVEMLVWDVPVRVIHWVLVGSFFLSYITYLLGPDYYLYHAAAGYSAIVLVMFRFVWGFVGIYHSRFVNFPCSPIVIWNYLKSFGLSGDRIYCGHNPLGAIMTLILLFFIFLQSVSGLFVSDYIFNAGPLNSLVVEEVAVLMEGIHRSVFYWLVLFVAMHVSAVFYHDFIRGERLIFSMITGKKIATSPLGSGNRPLLSGVLLGVLAVLTPIVCGVVVFWGRF